MANQIIEEPESIYYFTIKNYSIGDIIYECDKNKSVKTRIISAPQRGEDITMDGRKYETWDWKAEIVEVYKYKCDDNGSYRKILCDYPSGVVNYRISSVPCQGQPDLYTGDYYHYWYLVRRYY